MKPYYEDVKAGIVIYHGDALEILPSIAGIGAIITDPPFGVNGGSGHDAIHRPRPLKYGIDGLDTEDYVRRVCVPVIELCRRVSPIVVVTPGVRCCWLYPRPDDMGCFWCPAAARRSPWGFATFSPILYYGKDWRAGRGSIPTGIMVNESAENNGHPCPKPLKAWTWLVQKAAQPGTLICDPMVGSGTTLRAAKDLNLMAVGIDIDESYCEISARRLAQEVLAL